MTDFLPPMDGAGDPRQLADPPIRIVSMTVTEGGYFINPATGAFDPENPAIAADAANPDAPKTVFGLILAGLRARRAAGVAALHRDLLRQRPAQRRRRAATPSPASPRRRTRSFAAWIRDNVAFPNGMVDRIAPATSDRERAITRDEFGIEDAWPVFCEDFIQWVVEDHFPAGRPAFEEVGAQFVADVTPFEHMKIRILNGGHAIIAYPSGLMDIHFVHEGMADPLVRAFLTKVETEEILPILPPVPGTDLDDYFAARSSAAATTPRSATPSAASASTAPTASPSSSSPRSPTASTAACRSQGLALEVRALGPLLRRHHRLGQGHRAQRPELGPPAGPGRSAPEPTPPPGSR